ncbi:hypothetical protein [Traorella massiliensis]|uniref:hypothetical protein n=1 Tax=Traorella massiliensis TaxID=1903263 RepID=UPI0023532B0E|nr:hypothetical protein [Traorella massiliensis]
MKEKLDLFCKENPFDFSKEQLNRLKYELEHPRIGLICDEMVDYTLWIKGLKSRQEYFADYVARIFTQDKYPHLLEVGCGHHARLSSLLVLKGYKMSAMDPKLENIKDSIEGIQDFFNYEKTSILKYDAIIAQEPCDATEHIIRLCTKEKKDFIISLCASPHRFINGEMPGSADEWYDYLQAIDPNHTILIYPNMVPVYNTPVMIGMFGKKGNDRDDN